MITGASDFGFLRVKSANKKRTESRKSGGRGEGLWLLRESNASWFRKGDGSGVKSSGNPGGAGLWERPVRYSFPRSAILPSSPDGISGNSDLGLSGPVEQVKW